MHRRLAACWPKPPRSPHHGPCVQAERWLRLSSSLLELVGFPRIDKILAKSKEYVACKEKNGDVDPFGPDGQPHFEIDFVVCVPYQPIHRLDNVY